MQEIYKNTIEQKKKFELRESSYFKIISSDEELRNLMYFIQQEGIISQNSFSESSQSNSPERTFHLWIDKKDEEKIKKFLSDKSFSS